jgi:hypothetical protein
MITLSTLALCAVVLVSVLFGALVMAFSQWLDDNFNVF